MLVRLLQPSNAQLPISFTLSRIVTLVKPLQPENAPNLIVVTPSGIIIDFKDEQYSKTPSSE